MKKILFISVLCMVLAAGGFVFVVEDNPFIDEGTISGVRYQAGGIGKDDRKEMAKMSGDYNIKLVFTTAMGKYVAGVDVTIQDASGNAAFEYTCPGPWLYVDLEKGAYKVVADFNGVEKSTMIDAGMSAKRYVIQW
jgi:hypothetical protein